MRLFLAGLFVFGGVLLLVGLLGEVLEEWPTSLAVALVLGTGAALFWLSFRLFGGRGAAVRHRERVAEVDAERASDGTFVRREALEFRFAFTGTRRDGLDAYRAIRSERAGMRAWVRGAVIAMGVLWILGFVLTLPVLDESSRGPVWGWLLLGSGVLWFFVVVPAWNRANFRARYPAGEPQCHRITSRCIESSYGGSREGARDRARWWREVELILPSRTGIALSFVDGGILWLPGRVLAGENRERLVAEVEARLAQESLRSQERMEEHPVLEAPWEWAITGCRYELGSDDSPATLDLSLRRGAEERRLRFLEPVDVLLEPDFFGAEACGVAVLAVPHPELDGISVRVTGRSGGPGVADLWARDVVDLDATAIH